MKPNEGEFNSKVLHKILGRFKPRDDFENEFAWFKTRVPGVAPFAYLNIIYKPAKQEEQDRTSALLGLPLQLRDFYRTYNGAHFFVDALSIYGCVDPDMPYERLDFRKSLPFRILEVNEEFAGELLRENLVCIGSYGFDRSLVCVDRGNQRVLCFRGANLQAVRFTWGDFGNWLSSELERIGSLHSDSGELLTHPRETLPQADDPQ